MAVEQLITQHIDTWTSALRTRSTAGRGTSGKIDLYGIKKLRELILELAVRGKLVPQDPNDEPASELLKRIAAEKAEQVKQGKIKKQKPLPEISEEEKPFELPVGWEWARVGDIAIFTNGYAFKSSDFRDAGIGIVKIGDIDSTGFISTESMSYVDKSVVEVLPSEFEAEPGCLVIAMSGATTGKLGFNTTNKTFFLNQRVGKISPTLLNKYYLHYYLETKIAENLSISLGSAIPNISTVQINNILIPLPPEREQQLIVGKINELKSYCDQLEQQSLTSQDAHSQLVETLLSTLTDSQNAEELAENWARISQHFDTLFTTEASIDALKQTILQLAVMGKLVPQDPNDEPASELLKRIEQEKAQLVKEGKIKKQKPLPPISEEEKPFELPVGWEWCRFEDIVDIQSGITKGRKLQGRKLVTVPYLSVANVQRGYIDLSVVKTTEIPLEEMEKYKVYNSDLLITEGGDWDKVGRTAIWIENDMSYMAHQNHVFKARKILPEQDVVWLSNFLNGPFAREYFSGSSKQTTNLASINKTQLRGCLIAVPPKEEKERIVAKFNDLLLISDTLKSRLQSAQQTQLHLADALTDAALN
ncbi:Type I restriction enzyme EcoKI specificity protein [Yersinia intermedia]|uniref:restriction endonuclease subunit S n=1 Tax=Yersinia intermedia TaxID=631 RepID=UPI0005E9D93D|nr:restriction endonuclease subunit S [Yersinia intermedia]MDA5514179.1 restriction endonuclease subunit S [Yersinia intermedia]CQD81066.1 Type I restriction enzyme EcoKI specificity protein [Yersinia intermedia]